MEEQPDAIAMANINSGEKDTSQSDACVHRDTQSQ